MSAKLYHVGLNKVIEPEKRDVFHGLGEVYQQTWNPTTDRQDEVGEPTEYTLRIPAEKVKDFKNASNCDYVIPVREDSVDSLPQTDSWWTRFLRGLGFSEGGVAGQGPLPNVTSLPPNSGTLGFVGLDILLPSGYNGEGVVVIGGDTGFSERVKQVFGSRFLEGRNFTNEGGSNNTDDFKSGHGTGTGWMATPPKAYYMPHKVLRSEDGRGSSDGIAKSFYAAGDFAAANPNRRVIYNGSFSNGVDELYEPYTRAIKYATDRGVIFVFSAGNDNSYRLASPSNTSRINYRVISSIAFNRRDNMRAGFSNYHETGTLSGPGVREPGYNAVGAVVEWSGTSFSAPWTTFTLACLLTVEKGHKQDEVLEALKKNGRDTSEPTVEEGGGIVDAKAAHAKLTPPAPAPVTPPAKWLWRVQEGVYSSYLGASRAKDAAASKGVKLAVIKVKA